MPIPNLIEIVPLTKSVRAEITVPGSKSITNRALILAALAEGETTLRGALWSEDTQIMVECLQELGFMANVEPDPQESCNRIITVYGRGGLVPRGGTDQQPLELFVGNAGTAARFLAALVCLGQGVYRLHGVPRMHERPQAELFSALRQLGYGVAAERDNERLPARISSATLALGVQPRQGPGDGPAGARARSCLVSIEQSSQFASALLLCAATGNWQVEVAGDNTEESPYVRLTSSLITVFPKAGGTFQIEPDASSGSYFVAASKLIPQPAILESSEQHRVAASKAHLEVVKVAHWPRTGWQMDESFDWVLSTTGPMMLGLLLSDGGVRGEFTDSVGKVREGAVISRSRDLGDSIMTAMVLAPFAVAPIRFTDLGRLRLQECERVEALRTELTRCGAKVVEEGDTLIVHPSPLHGAEIETYDDHRMAMCFAILGLKVPGMKLKNAACVKKTFPNFFQKLAAAPPSGLGATILDARTGRALPGDELFAP